MTEYIDDLTGLTYGKLTVNRLDSTERYRQSNGRWQVIKYVDCTCSCGGSVVCRLGDLKSGRTTSCGCAKKGNNTKDLTGNKYLRLTAISRDVGGKWLCLCDCGNTKLVRSAQLTNGSIRSCGCLRAETTSKMSVANLQSLRVAAGLDPDKTITDDSTIQRAYFNSLAKEILKRDSFSCVWCNKTSARLNVHHISTWMAHPEIRFDEKNLISLCTECHKSVHKYGYHRPPDPIMSILMCGYTEHIDDYLMTNEEVPHALQPS